MERSGAVAGKRILVAEDETLIAMVVEDMLTELGYELAGSAHSVQGAMQVISGGEAINAAILDIELSDGVSWPIAAALQQGNVPFAFSSGHGADAKIDTRFANAPVLDKPFDTAALGDVLHQLLNAG